MKKRGLGHVEAIVSFVLFIGFLVFAFFFFSPLESNRVLDSSLTYAFIEIEANVTTTVERYSIVIGNEVTEPIIGIPLSSDNANSLATNSSGQSVGSFFDGNTVHFQRPDDNFVQIQFSDAFVPGTPLQGTILDAENYSVSSSSIETIYSEQQFLDLLSLYETDYTNVKTAFNLPNRVDFSFSVRFDDTVISAQQPIPENLEVVSTQERIELISTAGEIVFADLIVSVW